MTFSRRLLLRIQRGTYSPLQPPSVKIQSDRIKLPKRQMTEIQQDLCGATIVIPDVDELDILARLTVYLTLAWSQDPTNPFLFLSCIRLEMAAEEMHKAMIDRASRIAIETSFGQIR